MEAFDLAGNVSAPSLTARVTTWNSTPPTAPPSVVATAVSCQQIGLTWSPSTDPIAVAYYHVCRGTSAGNLAQVRITYGTPTAYTNYPLTPATKYYFGVEAVDTDGNVSPMSTVVSAGTLALPSPPVGGYNIFRGTAPSSLTQLAARNCLLLSTPFQKFANVFRRRGAAPCAAADPRSASGRAA